MDMSFEKQTHILNACLQAGRILIENGSEMARVIDTMQRIAYNAGVVNAQMFVTVTGIVISIDNHPNAQVASIEHRSIDLDKVARVNQLSRQFAQQEIDLPELVRLLDRIDNDTPTFSFLVRFLAAAMLSAVLLIIFTHEYVYAPAGFVIVGIVFAIFYFFNHKFQVQFLSEFFSSFVIGILALVAVKLGLGVHFDNIIIGS